ncbi:RING finger protein nhl-1-like [Gigantopelta aegis]|uniref:RING finger protein nhl-1-like n=1 Tax=Gigantopelta aegis TaxID=1735272 RepID=UPI001B88B5EB|nr:RING finger protein nhl-1-like [Gigantopelta aegis]
MTDPDLSFPSGQIEQLLTCSVCLDRYKTPKLLPCQHTFCQQPCLEGLVDRRTGMIRCPECRADHIVPRRGVSGYPNNLTVIGFLELASQSQRSSAGFQYEEAQATGPHPDEMPTNVPHAAGAVGGASSGCSVCHREDRLSRCGHCNQSVCDSCKSNHISILKSDIGRHINQIRRGIPDITESLNTIGHSGSQLQQRCEAAKTEISEAIEKHVRELRNRQRLLHGEIDSFLLAELRSLRMHQENIEVEVASMASFCDSTESMLNRSNHNIPDDDLVEIKRNCTDNLDNIMGYQSGRIRLPTLRQMQISLEDQFLSNTITNLGELIVTSGPPAAPTRHRTSQERDEASSISDDNPNIRVNQREATHSAQESHPNYALRVIRSDRSLSLSPSIGRRNMASSQQGVGINTNDEDGLRERPPLGDHSTPPVIRRRLRREHHSDPRLGSFMGRESDGYALDRSASRLRHRSTGALPPAAEEEVENGEALMYEPSSFIRERTFVRDAAASAVATNATSSMTQSLAQANSTVMPPFLTNIRPAVRFDITLDSNDNNGQTSEENSEIVPFSRTNSSPSIYVSSPRNKYNQKGQAVIRFGERGAEQANFTWPRGVAVSPLDDKIYVADSSNHRVQVFDNAGRYIRSFGAYGQNEGEFDCLAGIAVNGLNQVIVADRYNHRIQIFNRSGICQFVFGQEGNADGQLSYPWGVACDNMGFIYVCDKENHRIQVFQSNGTFVRKFGRLGKSVGEFENPHYLAVSNNNQVYVSDSSNNRIQVFSIYGNFLFSFGVAGSLRGQLKYPRGIAIDSQGFVVVADSGNNRVQIFRADGRYYSMFGSWGNENGKFKGLEGVGILANGNLVVSDRENHRIQIF